MNPEDFNNYTFNFNEFWGRPVDNTPGEWGPVEMYLDVYVKMTRQAQLRLWGCGAQGHKWMTGSWKRKRHAPGAAEVMTTFRYCEYCSEYDPPVEVVKNRLEDERRKVDGAPVSGRLSEQSPSAQWFPEMKAVYYAAATTGTSFTRITNS